MINDSTDTKITDTAVHVKCRNGTSGWVKFHNHRPHIGCDAAIQEQPFLMTGANSLIINELAKTWGETTIHKLTPV